MEKHTGWKQLQVSRGDEPAERKKNLLSQEEGIEEREPGADAANAVSGIPKERL